MDEGCGFDQDAMVRLAALQAIDNMADRAAAVGVYLYTTEEDLINAVESLAHALTNGKDNAFTCDPALGKTVSGR